MSQTENEKKYAEMIALCDQWIKAGQINQALDLIRSANMTKVPRRLRLDMAKVCRRIGLIAYGLRLLHPIIRGDELRADATDSEKCEYSVLLVRNGSVSEALTLLEKINSSVAPEALMYKAFCHIARWEYQEAVCELEKFMRSNVEPYMKLIGQVNLASSLIVVSRLDEAAALLRETLSTAQSTGASRLAGNCHELWGQLYFWKNDFQSARSSLAQALEILGTSPSYDRLLIDKTESVMRALETQSLAPLVQFREKALSRQHWESVREADLFSLKVKFQQSKLDHLIFGTPLAPYKQRIRDVVGSQPSDVYILGSKKSPCLDILTGQIDDTVCLSPGKKIHQVIACLVRDFYSPRNLGTLFSELYPGEYFDVASSPGRIWQLMMRTRQWLKEQKVPVAIIEASGSYHLEIEGSFGIKFSNQAPQIDSMELKWFELRKMFADHPTFAADDACQRLSWSRTGFRRLADWAFEKGLLKKSGSGRATCYEFISIQNFKSTSSAS